MQARLNVYRNFGLMPLNLLVSKTIEPVIQEETTGCGIAANAALAGLAHGEDPGDTRSVIKYIVPAMAGNIAHNTVAQDPGHILADHGLDPHHDQCPVQTKNHLFANLVDPWLASALHHNLSCEHNKQKLKSIARFVGKFLKMPR